MQAVSSVITVSGLSIPNPWGYINEVLNFWSDLASTAGHDILEVLRSRTRKVGSAEADVAHEQFKHVQWRLYERHLRRYDCRMDVPLRWERERFIRWSTRHSENFRHLLFLYQIDWFKRYADLTEAVLPEEQWRITSPKLEELLREIESHLYQ